MMLWLNWKLLLVCIVTLPLMAILTSTVSRPLIEYSSMQQRSLAKSNSVVQDAIGGIHIIKSYNLIQVMYRKFQSLLDQLLKNSLKVEKRRAAIGAVSVFAQTAPYFLFLSLGGYMAIQGHLTAGGLVAFSHLLIYLVPGLSILPAQISNYKVMAGAAGPLFEMLDERTERTGNNVPTVSPSVPAIQFQNVSCSYNGQRAVLQDVSFTLPQGATVALVGPSGSGKSTVFKLITGFYDYQGGSIELFDQPLSSLDISQARSMISLVSQETYLFSGTIADNIACGADQVDMAKVMRAARTANIDEFIQLLPDGYNTIVGERGVKLSGGQRQRLSIARAIFKDAPILLLDEPTSALDAESEMLVQEAVNRIMKHKTVLVVAHRLSTIIDADEVLVLDNGRIVERGTHAELLVQNGAYTRLYNKQMIKQADIASGEGA